MNDGLIDGFRHNAWATREIIAAARVLSPEELRFATPGTYGSTTDTLWHIVSSEASYYRHLTGEEPAWDYRADDAPGLDELSARAGDMAARWEQFLAAPFDAERTVPIYWEEDDRRDVPAGVILTQALHHGTDHRSQICTTLTVLGHTPPEIGAWNYAVSTGRAPRRWEG